MPQNNPPAALKLLATNAEKRSSGLPLPGLLQPATRSGASQVDPLLASVTVTEVYDLAPPRRSADGAKAEKIDADSTGSQLLAIEAEDGTTLFIRSDKLAEEIARIRPDAVGEDGVELAKFVDPNASSRGVGDVFWKSVSVLRLSPDNLIEEARQRALSWAKEKLVDRIAGTLAGPDAWSTALGAKALMWTIESRLAGRPGLYRWHDPAIAATDHCPAGDERLKAMGEGKPALVFIHGTGSYTKASFDGLRTDETEWKRLQAEFPGGIFGYEHRSFSQSPIENALELLENLPNSARLSLVTHSRGGLVGDLLCLGQGSAAAIDDYRFDPRHAADPDGLAEAATEERERLRKILALLAAKNLKVDRYVRVACPARGTRFLSDNFEVALSDFLNLMQSALGGLAALAGGPPAGEGASTALAVLKRLLLEIADKRLDPHLVPGIAAMLVDSPLAAFLAHPQTARREELRMAVIAGDTEFDGLGFDDFGRRIANLFCDWRLFDRNDNDLVVDTDSMYAGLSSRPGASYLYDQDQTVSHFRYFVNPLTRDSLRKWLVEPDLATIPEFQPLTEAARKPWSEQTARGGEAEKPVAIIVPDFMASDLRGASGGRLWLDFAAIRGGALTELNRLDSGSAQAGELWDRAYGDLAEFLSATHAVKPFAYDWRKSIQEAAEALGAVVETAATAHLGQPIRLLAHGAGGRVATTLLQSSRGARQVVLGSGGRLVLLGTPNKGTYQAVHALLGKTDTVRLLAKATASGNLQAVVDTLKGFPGLLQLLPEDGDSRDPAWWARIMEANTDRWLGDRIAGIPDFAALGAEGGSLPSFDVSQDPALAAAISCVFGQGLQTPCGVEVDADRGRLKLLFTAEGDGAVTWAAGRLDGLAEEQYWSMPVEHGGLTASAEYFPALAELLERGAADKLGSLPRQRGGETMVFALEAPPPVVPDAAGLARAVLGKGPQRRATSRQRQALKVLVRAGDLRFIDQPILCGHYTGDAISGAEAELDRMLQGRLSERKRLGLYPDVIGTSVLVLDTVGKHDQDRGSYRGAVIVGLGDFNGQLARRQVTETVRAGVLRYLLLRRDFRNNEADDPLKADNAVKLTSLLIGYSSSANMTVAESVAAITLGVLEANHQFKEVLGRIPAADALVRELNFIEVFRDSAISAAKAVLDLPKVLATELKRLETRLDPASTLAVGEGVVDRLSASDGEGHWSRLIVTDADAAEANCPPECYETRQVTPLPPELLRRLNPDDCGCRKEAAEGAGPASADVAGKAAPPYYPRRLKFVFLSPRARAESVVQQGQPGFVDTVVHDQRVNPRYDDKLGKLLFHLMVPLDYKSSAREQSRLLLVLDRHTAALPWELLLADREPMVLSTRLVRQLTTARYRPSVRTANTDSACIIVAPSTEGYDKVFGGKLTRLDELKGAAEEGEAVRATLIDAGWDPDSRSMVFVPDGKMALDVLFALHQRPYRVLMIAAHGIVNALAKDGQRYSGVVLSNGLLLTANEIGAMEVVPEVVFLNCCHLGSMGLDNASRFAASLAGELIEMGVRCVIAAGWAVDDQAAKTFSSTFFRRFAADGDTFAEAVFAARKATFRQHPGTNTWGAYQAYGDPSYRLKPNGAGDAPSTSRYVAVDELLSALAWKTLQIKQPPHGKKPGFKEVHQWILKQLRRGLPEWNDLPAVQQAIGAAFAECGTEGFEAARSAYLRAIQLEDERGTASLRSVEQLANLEARHGAKLADDPKRFDEGLKLIDAALERLDALSALARAGSATPVPNSERACLLGSARKRRGLLLASQKRYTWKQVSAELAKSAEAYRSGMAADPAKSPYPTLNALPLAWLTGSLAETETADLARRCGTEASRQFGTSLKFWDGVMAADAELTARLIEGSALLTVDALEALYRDAVKNLPQSAREWHSVVAQWRILAALLGRLGAASPAQKAGRDIANARELGQLLEELATRLDPHGSEAREKTGPESGPEGEPGAGDGEGDAPSAPDGEPAPGA